MQACGRRRVVDGEASALWCTEIERCCAARNDIWQEMASVYGTRMEGDRKVQELEEALVDRQMSKAALEQELSRLQSLLADSAQSEEAREHQMSDVLESLQQASSKTYVLEHEKVELERQVSNLRRQVDTVSSNAKKVLAQFCSSTCKPKPDPNAQSFDVL